MSVKEQTTEETIVRCQNWCRLAICITTPVKEALIGILHNTVSNPSINRLPTDPTLLYNHMVTNKNKLKNNKFLKEEQLAQLLPREGMVFSKSFDITILRFLIQKFSGITNEDNHWKKPRHNDHSIAAAVYRAADLRNRVFHYRDPQALGNEEFEEMWREIEVTLKDLCYEENISDFKEKSLDPVAAKKLRQLHANMAEDFEKILDAYKEKCKNEKNEELKTFIARNYKNVLTNEIVVDDMDTFLSHHDSIMVSGEAGLGKTFSAKNLRYLWASEKILAKKKLLYIDSKKVIRNVYKPSHAAPIYISELGNMLKDKTAEYLKSFGCVKKSIENLIIVIDGVDELPIEENKLHLEFLNELRAKIDENVEISAMETIMGIYFGIFFPGSKIIVFGRKNEIERLKDIQDQYQQSNLFDRQSRAVLELQPLDDDGVKGLISRVNCKKKMCCCAKCVKTYSLIEDVEFRNIPSQLLAMIKIFDYLPNRDFGRITKTKIFIITLFNLLKNHTQTGILKDVKTFKRLLSFDKTNEFRECIQKIAMISFFSLLDKKVAIEVEAYNENDVDYFKYEQTVRKIKYCVKIKRDILEQLDFFYVRDSEHHVILEPYHLTNMEFLASCHIYCHPDEWNFLLKFKKDRQSTILPFVAGLHSNENFTKDFLFEVFQDTNRDIENYLNWLFSVENVFKNLSRGSWYGLKESGDLFPSFDLLYRINEEVDVFDNISRRLEDVQTLVCFCYGDFEWFEMENFKHTFITNNRNIYNIKSFMSKFEKYHIIIKQNITITNHEHFNLLLEMFNNDKVQFRINYLYLNYSISHEKRFKTINTYLKCTSLWIEEDCNSPTVDSLLNAIQSSSTSFIKCKRLGIVYTAHFNAEQIERYFLLGLFRIVDSIMLGMRSFFTDQQIKILKAVERNHANREINIELSKVEFNWLLVLPNLGKRHIFLSFVNDVTDKSLICLKALISPGYTRNFSNYKIINSHYPFVRQDNYSPDSKQSMYLHMSGVDLRNVSPEVFANTFSLIPSLSLLDTDLIPSSHWLSLSQSEDCQINEMRIWRPQSKNLEYFFNIKTKLMQFIIYDKVHFKELLTHIVNSQNIQFDKEIKVFVVKYDIYDWDYYKEIPLFGAKTIREYKSTYRSDDLQVDNFRKTFYEGQQNWWWCCEISHSSLCPSCSYNCKGVVEIEDQNFIKGVVVENDDGENDVEDIEDELSAICIKGEKVRYKVIKKHLSNEFFENK